MRGRSEHDHTKGLMESEHRTTEAMWAHHRAVFWDRPQGLVLNKKCECVVLNKEGEWHGCIKP
jgi:hypothetical protein